MKIYEIVPCFYCNKDIYVKYSNTSDDHSGLSLVCEKCVIEDESDDSYSDDISWNDIYREENQRDTL